MERLLEFGAHPTSDNQTEFRVWAPKAKRLKVEFITRKKRTETVERSVSLERGVDGVFVGTVSDCPAGTLYRYQFDNHPGRPDPYSRFQPYGVHGPSQVVDPTRFQWNDDQWLGVKKTDLVVYELHVGSFTMEGTYAAAVEKLADLKQLGITAIELLPLAQTPGKWNWGYDGVNYYAPRNTFGPPDELKAFVAACHALGFAVIHDVVFNHVGPEGNYLNEFAPYRSPKHGTPWGDSLNFDGPQSTLVREFVIKNCLFWIDEYHFDGLRLDAIHFMFDESDRSIVHEIRARFREYEKTVSRQLYLIAESNIFDPDLVPDASGDKSNYDAIWSDCLMHSIYSHGNPELRLTDRTYVGSADLAEALQHAYVFSAPQAFRVGADDRKKHHPDGDRNYIQSLIMALQTHDSVGNHPHGKRLHELTSFEFQKAAAPLILLYPSIPMIFMGEEWAANKPFPFFADFEDHGLRAAVDKGRRDEYPHHDWAGSPLPSDPLAFSNSKLNYRLKQNDNALAATEIPTDETALEQSHQEMWHWYQRLLELRRRGLADGWLDVRYMSTEHDSAHDVFKLIYQTADQRVVIASRLAMPASASISLRLPSSTDLMIDSQFYDLPPTEVNGSEVKLMARHACAWIEYQTSKSNMTIDK